MDGWKGLAATILVVAGDDLEREELSSAVAGRARSIEWTSGADAAARVALGGLDLLVLDLAATGTSLLELIELARVANPQLVVIVLAGADDVQTAVEALERGAADYVTKPLDLAVLAATVDRMLDLRRLQLASNIASIVHRMAAIHEADKLPPRVVDAAIQATRARNASVYLYEEGALTLLGSSQSTERKGVRALVELVLDRGQPVQTLEEDEGPILGWPMVAHNQGIGVLVASRDPGSPHFTAVDEQQMSVVATEAALSLDRVRLIGRLRQQVDDLARARLSLAAGEQLQGVGQLATGYAHELQGPIQYLQSHLRSTVDALRAKDLDEVGKGLTIAIETAARIQSMVGELSLLGRGKDDAVIDAARVVALARRIALADSGITVTESVAYAGVQGNVGHLVQAVVHLLRNAVRACQDAENPTIGILVTPEDGEIRFTVIDNGPGLPAGLEEHLFDPFVTTWEGHSGLGLGIARKIAEDAGGRVTVRSLEGGGTEAAMWLPGVDEDSLYEVGDD